MSTATYHSIWRPTRGLMLYAGVPVALALVVLALAKPMDLSSDLVTAVFLVFAFVLAPIGILLQVGWAEWRAEPDGLGLTVRPLLKAMAFGPRFEQRFAWSDLPSYVLAERHPGALLVAKRHFLLQLPHIGSVAINEVERRDPAFTRFAEAVMAAIGALPEQQRPRRREYLSQTHGGQIGVIAIGAGLCVLLFADEKLGIQQALGSAGYAGSFLALAAAFMVLMYWRR